MTDRAAVLAYYRNLYTPWFVLVAVLTFQGGSTIYHSLHETSPGWPS